MANLLNASIVFRPDLIGETRSLTKRLNNWWIIRFLFIFIDLLHSWLCSLIRRSSLADEYKCQSVWGNWQFSRPFVDDDRRLPPTFLWPTRGFYAYRSIRIFFFQKKNKINWFSHQIRGGLISVPDRIQFLSILLVRHDKFVLIKTITKGDSPPSLTPLLCAVFQTYR